MTGPCGAALVKLRIAGSHHSVYRRTYVRADATSAQTTSGHRLKMPSIPSRIGRDVRLALVSNIHCPKTNLILRFAKPLVCLDDIAPSPCEGRKYRGSRVESILADDRGQVGLSPSHRQSPIKLSDLCQRHVYGFLGSKEALRDLHGGIPAFFEHDFSLFAERGPAALNSVL